MEKIRESYHEEEALEDVSLCDLPLLNSPTKHQEEEEEKEEINELNKNDKNEAQNDVVFEPQEEFAFGSAGSKMCAADEVFFRGQILPLRPSFGSDAINPTQLNLIQNSTRLESLDRSSLTGFTIISSRSSSSSSRSTTQPEATPIAITRVASEPRLRTRSRNQFHTHPSPKLHMRASSARSSATSTTGARLDRASSNKTKHKSSVWDFFKLGLVRTPDIELQDIRPNLRNNNRAILKGANSTTTTLISRSSSDNGNNNNNNFNTNTSSRANDTTTSESSKNVEKQKGMKFLSGCTCSSEAVASNAIVAKSKGNSNENSSNNMHGISGTKSSNWTKLEKLLLLEEDHRLIKMKNNINNCDNYHYYKKKQSGRDNDDDDDQKQKKQYLKDQGRRKQAHVSHHRTYEWLKELSHANLAMHV